MLHLGESVRNCHDVLISYAFPRRARRKRRDEVDSYLLLRGVGYGHWF